MDVLTKIKEKMMETKKQEAKLTNLDSKLNNQEINLLEKIIRVERDIVLLNHLFPDAQKQIQNTLSILAESNQKMAIHFEQTKRYYEKLENLENIIFNIQQKFIEIDRNFVDLKIQIKELQDFSNTIKRIFWVITSSLMGICIWIAQKWAER